MSRQIRPQLRSARFCQSKHSATLRCRVIFTDVPDIKRIHQDLRKGKANPEQVWTQLQAKLLP